MGKENFINFQGKKYIKNKINETKRVNGNIIEPFNDGPVHKLNKFEQDEMTLDENLLAKKKYDLATRHKTFMERNQDLLLETRECVKRCQNSTEKQKLTKKEWRVQKRSCLAGCGVYTGEIDMMEKYDGTYKNDNGEHEIPKCDTLREHAEAPPPTKVIGEQCASSKECFSFNCGNLKTGGECKGKCSVEGKTADSFTEILNGNGVKKTFCGDKINRLMPDKNYIFFFRTGNIWNSIDGFHTSLAPIKFCKSLTRDKALQILNIYGIRCYGILHKKGTSKYTLLEDPNNGIPKPTWKDIKDRLVNAGGLEKGDGLTPVKNLPGGWDPRKMREGKGEVGEGDADRNRDCKSGKYIEDPLRKGGLEKYGLTGRVSSRWTDYCIDGGDKVFFNREHPLWGQIGNLLDMCEKDNCDVCFSEQRVEPPLNWKYVRSGECLPNGRNEWIKYRNKYDNRGSWSQKVKNCAEACKNDSRDSKGFVVYPYGYYRGRCWCEKNDSGNCRVSRNAYRRYDFVKSEPAKTLASLDRCAYEKPEFPYTLLLNLINPKYNKTDFVVGKWHWWPKWRGVSQWPDWWGNDWLAGLGVVWGNWGYGTRYSPFQGRGRIGAENACNRSSDCIGFFESRPNQFHFIFEGNNEYNTKGSNKNVRNIWVKDGTSIPKPEPQKGKGPTGRLPRWWWGWWFSTSDGKREYNSKKNIPSSGYCGTNGSLDKYVGKTDSVGECAEKCRKMKMRYAGVGKGNLCYCGNNYWKNGMSRDCTKKCKKDKRPCGGKKGVNMYYSGYRGEGDNNLENLDGPPEGTPGPKFSKSGFQKPKPDGVCPPDQSYIEFFSNIEPKKDYSHLKILAGLGTFATACYLYQKD